MVDLNAMSASDWKFDSIGELDMQMDQFHHSRGLRLYQFHSPVLALSAYVLFAGTGFGQGFKWTMNDETLHLAFNSFDNFSQPTIGKDIKLKLPRNRSAHLCLERVTVRRGFNMYDLHGTSGEFSSAGAGLGVGVGAVFATAKDSIGGSLFECYRIGLDFGRVGASASTLRGTWWVPRVWLHR